MLHRFRIVCDFDIEAENTDELVKLLEQYSEYQYGTPGYGLADAIQDTIEYDGFGAWMADRDHQLYIVDCTSTNITTGTQR